MLLRKIRGTFGTFNRADFWHFQQAGSICETDRIAIVAEKIRPESRRAEGRIVARAGFGASPLEENRKDARTTRNSRNLDRQENEALGDDWAAPVC
jgi:hypothetical protein